MLAQSLPAKSRTEQTFSALHEALIAGEFLPGSRLRIDQLGKRFDASIGAVREALSRLTAEGLVVAMPQKGFIVAPVSRKDLKDLTEVRVDVENRCLIGSIRNGDLNWEGRIISLQHQLRALGPATQNGRPEFSPAWHEVHEAFHDALTEACPNGWWLRLRRQLFIQSERYRRYSGPIELGNRDVTQEHDAIIEAAIAKDEKAAAEAMATHLWTTTELLLASDLPFSEDQT